MQTYQRKMEKFFVIEEKSLVGSTPVFTKLCQVTVVVAVVVSKESIKHTNLK
jgi:hypothetical protein